jgi:tetratricopeptide (TPR) repeat protein
MWWLLPLGALIGALGYEARIHLWLPALAHARRLRGDEQAVDALFRQIVEAPSLVRGGAKPGALFQLAWRALERGEPKEAEELCRRALALQQTPGFQSLVRQRLADALDALGRDAEALAEREAAARALEHAPDSSGVRLARARELARAGRAEEACEQYQAALDRLPAWNGPRRAQMLVWLALAEYQAGRPEETACHAEEAIALKPGPFVLMTAHSVAGIGYSTQRLLDRAEEHRELAFRLATEAGSEDRAGNYLASLAATQKARGHLVEAMQAAEKAAYMSFKSRRHARLVEADCLWSMGRFDAALTCIEQAQKAKPHPQVSEERRSQATLALARGLIEADAGRPEAALRSLQEAAPGLRDSPKLCLWHDAAMVVVLAMLDRDEEARALIAGIQARSEPFERDVATQERCAAGVGRALLLLGKPEAARPYWLRVLAGPPDPVDRPAGYYYLGECELQMGNEDAAYHAYRSAANLGIETRHARLARTRLKELEAPQQAAPAAAERGN